MSRRIMVLCLLPAVAMLTGCSGISGHWVTQSVEPQAAADKFELANLCLMKDGTYKAEAKYEGEVRTSEGKYEYQNNQLTFMAEGDKTRTYDAKLNAMQNVLTVKGGDEGERWTATMKRCSKCGSNPNKCCGCCAGTCPADKK